MKHLDASHCAFDLQPDRPCQLPLLLIYMLPDMQYGGSLLAGATTPRLADLHQLMKDQVGWSDSWDLDVFLETQAAGAGSLQLLDNQASLAKLGLRHGDVLCYQRARASPQVLNPSGDLAKLLASSPQHLMVYATVAEPKL